MAPSPRRQDGNQVCERGQHVVLDTECLGQGLRVAAVDGLPEAGLSRVLRRQRVRAAQRVLLGLGPELLVLEDVRRKVDPVRGGSLEAEGPVHVGTAYVQFRQCLEQ